MVIEVFYSWTGGHVFTCQYCDLQELANPTVEAPGKGYIGMLVCWEAPSIYQTFIYIVKSYDMTSITAALAHTLYCNTFLYVICGNCNLWPNYS